MYICISNCCHTVLVQGLTNEAFNAVAVQSSTRGHHPAQLAINGSMEHTFSMTKVENDPWWMMTFNNIASIINVLVLSQPQYGKLTNTIN